MCILLILIILLYFLYVLQIRKTVSHVLGGSETRLEPPESLFAEVLDKGNLF